MCILTPESSINKTRDKKEEAKGMVPAVVKKLFKIPLACFGIIVILIVIISGIFAPLISPYDPLEINISDKLQGPSIKHLAGTDELGRDILSRIIYGSRISLIVSIGAVSISTVIGTALGLIAAHSRGVVDDVIMRIMDAMLSFPSLVLALGLVAALGAGLANIVIALGVATIPWMARVVRSQALSIKERDFVKAAQAIGGKDMHIISRHIWPNCTAPVIVQSTMTMAWAILAEAGLSFLGLGVPVPSISWGMMLRLSFPLVRVAPMLPIVSGLAIFVTVLAFNFVGDALRDILDPRLRGIFH